MKSKGTQRIATALWIALGLLASTGLCGCQIFQVRDAEGKVIPWATVNILTSKGESNFPMWTGMLGEASTFVSTEPQGTTEWIEVSKKGYRTNKVQRTQETKMTIVLQKLSGPDADLDTRVLPTND